MKIVSLVTLTNILEKYTKDNTEAHLPISLSLKLYDFLQKATKARELFVKEMQSIINEYGQKDENGKPLLNEDKSKILIIPGKEPEVDKKLQTLYSENIDISIDLTAEDLAKMDLSLHDIFEIKNCISED